MANSDLSCIIQSELYGTTLEELKKEARWFLKSEREPSVQMKLIDSMQRLGVAYHFEEEIRDCIDHVHEVVMDDLYTQLLFNFDF